MTGNPRRTNLLPRRALTPVLAFVFVALLVPGIARGQRGRLDSLLDRATALQVHTLIDSARAAGLPIDGLTAVALEGVARHAPRDRIIAAVRTSWANLEVARGALGVGTRDAELTAGAGAVESGVTPAQLTELRRVRPGRTLTIPLVVLSDLAARGVPVDTATRSVYVSVAKGARDEDLVAFRSLVEQDIQSGAAPGSATVARVEHLPGMTAADVHRFWTMNHIHPEPP